MKDLIKTILSILGHAGRIISLVRNTIFNTLLFLLLIVLVVGYFASSPKTVPTNSILQLTLKGDIVEERRPTSAIDTLISESLGSSDEPQYVVLQDILDSINAAAYDPAVKAILLDLKGMGSVGLNQMQAIGTALNDFKHQGKKVLAAEDFYTQKQYYLAAYADTVILNPMGGVDLHGFGLYPLYFKDALDKLQVNYHVFKVGTYKSAVEPITRNSMSDEVRGQNLQWLNMLWNTYTSEVVGQRQKHGLTTALLSEYISDIDTKLAKTEGDTAKLALDTHLVDMLLTREQLDAYLESVTGTDDLSLVSTDDYLTQIEPSYTTAGPKEKKIGIIIAEGTILGGDQPAGAIGCDSLTERLRMAREDDSVKGVVLRVNSGGGSAFASEIIRQEILELKKAGKPVVVSMGTMAASGGYWISADADEIWASPTTLTGSIGIFGAIPTFERTLNTLGIHSDGVGTTGLSAGMNLAQPLTPELEQSIQLTVDHGYARFLDIVEKGRKIERKNIDGIAQGRVFSGERARQLKLVDHLGTLEDAIAATARLAGIKEYAPVYIERKVSLREQIMQHLSTVAVSLYPEIFHTPQIQQLYSRLRKEPGGLVLMGDPQGLYAQTMVQLPF